MIDARQLRYFSAVAEHLHFGRAADTLHVAQSALSVQIRRLEEDLGTRLLNRGKRASVSLTEAGALFLAEAKIALRQIDRAERVGKLAARGLLGRLQIGYIASAAINGLLPDMLGTFRETSPTVDIGLVSLDTPAQIRAVADGTIDVGLVRTRTAYPDTIASRLIHTERLHLAMARTNPLTRKDRISSRDAAAHPFIVPQFDGDSGFLDYLAELGRRAGVEIDQAIKVPDLVSALSMCAGGYGVALVPACFANFPMAGVVVRQMEDFAEEIGIHCIWQKRTKSPALAAMLDVISGFAGQLAAP
ncbi:LysR substrate-binding domain-containing protein [Sphingobium sp. CECT 9361]|uniref:LysR substrate-binding domain-containing protein n=1 Tax=Sphingobium sp. CECT 9361 TaxID=2845384 RepID=UPI001E51DE64|nr:LysR substrate-binding domain-containing protein [Sphingobium sp. CECT 9361]CAH0356553.1 Hca operon transcriptional activator HcaR [Sphingobium sp. CECT 9361]